jgi:hypothetical protein
MVRLALLRYRITNALPGCPAKSAAISGKVRPPRPSGQVVQEVPAQNLLCSENIKSSDYLQPGLRRHFEIFTLEG